MLPFVVDIIEELEDGRIFVQWDTVADDGNRLVEGDYWTPEPGETIEECVEREVARVKAARERINAAPKYIPARKLEPPRKSAPTMSEQARAALARRLSNG